MAWVFGHARRVVGALAHAGRLPLLRDAALAGAWRGSKDAETARRVAHVGRTRVAVSIAVVVVRAGGTGAGGREARGCVARGRRLLTYAVGRAHRAAARRGLASRSRPDADASTTVHRVAGSSFAIAGREAASVANAHAVLLAGGSRYTIGIDVTACTVGDGHSDAALLHVTQLLSAIVAVVEAWHGRRALEALVTALEALLGVALTHEFNEGHTRAGLA